MNCGICEEKILPGEITGDADGNTHHECAFRAVAGSVAHQMKRCSCYGGAGEDDPNLTIRQNALAALRFFRSTEAINHEKKPDILDAEFLVWADENYPEICFGCDHPEDWCVCHQNSY